MPKQSARFKAVGDRVITYQPAKVKKQIQDLIWTIKSQLPRDFQTFTEQVIVKQITFCYKRKKVYSDCDPKTTRPDLQDNLMKPVFDALEMAGVLRDDSIVHKIENANKCLCKEDYILIHLAGK